MFISCKLQWVCSWMARHSYIAKQNCNLNKLVYKSSQRSSHAWLTYAIQLKDDKSSLHIDELVQYHRSNIGRNCARKYLVISNLCGFTFLHDMRQFQPPRSPTWCIPKRFASVICPNKYLVYKMTLSLNATLEAFHDGEWWKQVVI